jgi:hypothetical protein
MTKTHFLTMHGTLSRGNSVVYASFVVDWRHRFPVQRLLKAIFRWSSGKRTTLAQAWPAWRWLVSCRQGNSSS